MKCSFYLLITPKVRHPRGPEVPGGQGARDGDLRDARRRAQPRLQERQRRAQHVRRNR